MKQKDVIRWVIDCMLAHEASITEELALIVERECRAEWGGREVRIWKTAEGRPGRPRKVPYVEADAYADGLTAVPTETVLRKHGISRSSLYRLMKRDPK